MRAAFAAVARTAAAATAATTAFSTTTAFTTAPAGTATTLVSTRLAVSALRAFTRGCGGMRRTMTVAMPVPVAVAATFRALAFLAAAGRRLGRGGGAGSVEFGAMGGGGLLALAG